MAKGTATCTCATCGKEFLVQKICANRSDANSWEAWAEAHYDECNDCRRKRIDAEHEEENREAAELAAAMNLPELHGSPNQVAWATTIRQTFIGNAADEEVRMYESISRTEARIAGKGPDNTEDWLKDRLEEKREQLMVLQEMRQNILKQTGASFWIDHRTYSVSALMHAYILDVEEGRIQREVIGGSTDATPEEVKKSAAEEMTVAPENHTHPGAAEIIVTEKMVSASYRKDDDFRSIVKSLGYSWDASASRWSKKITVTTGTAKERAAELGNKLLNSGFAVTIADEEIRNAAVNGDYEPQTYRWITRVGSGKHEGKLYISWGRDDAIYRAAKKLHGAVYSSPGFVIAPKEYAIVEDFAHIYGFKFSPGAMEAIEAEKNAVIVVTPAAAKDATYDEHPVYEILNQSGIISDLVDE